MGSAKGEDEGKDKDKEHLSPTAPSGSSRHSHSGSWAAGAFQRPRAAGAVGDQECCCVKAPPATCFEGYSARLFGSEILRLLPSQGRRHPT